MRLEMDRTFPSRPQHMATRYLLGFARLLTLALLLTLPLLTPHRAAAAEPSGPSSEEGNESSDSLQSRASALYERGVHAFEGGRYREAVDHFLAADRILPSAPLSYNAALAYENLRDVPGALRFYRDYLRRDPSADNAPAVRRRIRTLEQELSRRGLQQVSIRSEPPGATVTIDGNVVGVTPWTGQLKPGRHELALVRDAHHPVHRPLVLAGSSSIELVETLKPKPRARDSAVAGGGATRDGPVASDAGPEPGPEKDSGEGAGRASKTVAWALLGASGLSFLTAGGFELLRREAESDARRAKASSQIEYERRLESMQERQTTARVCVAAGGALLVAGGALFFFRPSKGRGQARAEVGCSSSGCFGAVKGSF